jgi:hypothetical protein
MYAGRPSSLGEVLAGEACGKERRLVRKRLQPGDILVQLDGPETILQDFEGGGLLLAQEQSAVTCPVESQFDTSDAGE